MATITVKNSAGVDTVVQAPPAPGQALMVASVPVVLASDQTAVPVSLASSPLPTGAATEATLAAQSAKLPASLGSKTISASLAVAPASDAFAVQPASSCSLLLSAAASTNSTSVKGTAGAVKSIQGYNAAASPRFLKFYNKATAPTVGTDTPVKTLYLPATSAFVFDFPAGYAFATGIGYGITAAAATADTTALTAGDIVCLNVDYI